MREDVGIEMRHQFIAHVVVVAVDHISPGQGHEEHETERDVHGHLRVPERDGHPPPRRKARLPFREAIEQCNGGQQPPDIGAREIVARQKQRRFRRERDQKASQYDGGEQPESDPLHRP